MTQAQSFKEALGALGYVGFAYMAADTKPDPAQLLLDALNCDDLDARVLEALPWVVVAFPALNWEWLSEQARARGRQNRLAFVVDVAAKVAIRKGNLDLVPALKNHSAALEPFRLPTEDTLCRNSMYESERIWLRLHRSEDANHWNLLTDMNAEHLDHAIL